MGAHPPQRWLRQGVEKRIRDELAKIQVEVNEEKTRTVDLRKGERFGFLGFEYWEPGPRNGPGECSPGIRNSFIKIVGDE